MTLLSETATQQRIHKLKFQHHQMFNRDTAADVILG